LVFIAAPFAFGFSGIDAPYSWAFGTTILIVTVALSAPSQESLKVALA